MYVGVLLNLGYPIANRFERSTVGDVVDQEDALGTAEVRRGNGAETFLARRVPNLKFDPFSVHLDVLNLKVYPDGRDEGGREGVVGVSEKQASFTDAGVADHEQFALHVVGGSLGHGVC